MDLVHYILRAAPEIALFVALALGQLLGRVNFGRFRLGGVAGSLIVALLIGQLGVTLPDALKSVCFALFIYSVGFKSGPEFFGKLDRSSAKLVISAVVHCLVALVAIVGLAKVCGLDPGFAVGLGAGSLTQTAMLGTGADAVSRLGLDPAQVKRLTSEMAVGFAITYVFGTVGVIIFIRSVAPRLLGVDMRKAARELESELSEEGEVSRPGFITPYVPMVTRAFEIGKGKGAGHAVAELEMKLDGALIERVVRGNEILEHTPDLVLKAGDVAAISGRLPAVVAAADKLGDEVESKEALSFPIRVVRVVITDKRLEGRTLRQVRNSFQKEEALGVYLLNFERQGLPQPILLKTQLRRGDVLELAGRQEEVERAANVLGYTESKDDHSDLAYHALAIVAGTLLGLLSVNLGGIPMTLGVGGGVLVAGLAFGWWHARYPVHGALPGPAQWLLSEFGISAFAAVIGLSAGPAALAAIQQHGVMLVGVGVIATLVPLFTALYFGHYVLKLHPVILLGALAGGQTVAAALTAANDETESVTPVLGFTVTYAISNVLLAVWGPVIVALTGG